MTIQASGAISLSQLQAEFGGSGAIGMSEYYAVDVGVPIAPGFPSPNPALKMSDFYSKDYTPAPSITNTHNAFSAANAASYTFSNVPVGAVDPTSRIVAIAVSIDSTEASAVSIADVTFNGASMVKLSGLKGVAVYRSLNNAATTPDIVVTTAGGNAGRCVISVYRIVDHTTTAHAGVGTKTDNAVTTPPNSLRGCVGVCAAYMPNTADTKTNNSAWVDQYNTVATENTRHLSAMMTSSLSRMANPNYYALASGDIYTAYAYWR